MKDSSLWTTSVPGVSGISGRDAGMPETSLVSHVHSNVSHRWQAGIITALIPR